MLSAAVYCVLFLLLFPFPTLTNVDVLFEGMDLVLGECIWMRGKEAEEKRKRKGRATARLLALV